jgi:hypothetical protein
LLLNAIQFHDLGIQHAASLDAVTEDAVSHALQLILNPAIYPLMSVPNLSTKYNYISLTLSLFFL